MCSAARRLGRVDDLAARTSRRAWPRPSAALASSTSAPRRRGVDALLGIIEQQIVEHRRGSARSAPDRRRRRRVADRASTAVAPARQFRRGRIAAVGSAMRPFPFRRWRAKRGAASVRRAMLHMPPLSAIARHSPDARRRAAARRRGAVDLRRATASPWSAATARANRRCCASPPARLPPTRGALRPARRAPALPAAGARFRAASRRRSIIVLAGLGDEDEPVPRARHDGRARRRSEGAIPSRLSGGEARRAALARVLSRRARHPAARRADQPSRSRRRSNGWRRTLGASRARRSRSSATTSGCSPT